MKRKNKANKHKLTGIDKEISRVGPIKMSSWSDCIIEYIYILNNTAH